MRAALRRVALAIGLALAAGAIWTAWNAEALLDRYAPFDLREAPNALTPIHLYFLRARAAKCYAVLERSGVAFSRADLAFNDRGCGYDDGVSMTRSSVSYGGNVVLRCAALASLQLWERHVLVPEAKRILKRNVRSVQTFGTYSCRNVNHAKTGRLSQHATANAIDIAGFTFDDGSSVSVLRDWDKGERGEFLRAVRDGACRFFRGVLSPDYNEAHANHFHFDMGWWSVCR
jgi:hypothetical protein